MSERIRRDARDREWSDREWGDGGAPLGAPLDDAVLRLRGGRPGDDEVDETAVARVMDAVRARPRPERTPPPAPQLVPARAPLRWRRPVLLTGALVAAALLVAALGARERGATTGAVAVTPATPAAATPSTQSVRFTLAAPATAQVTLVGDFNAWNAGATPMRWDAASGRWAVELELPRGRYSYSFVLDGERWLADPEAPLAPDDGFGSPSSVVVVSGDARRG